MYWNVDFEKGLVLDDYNVLSGDKTLVLLLLSIPLYFLIVYSALRYRNELKWLYEYSNIHNLGLSLFSLFIFIISSYSIIETENKLSSIYNLHCLDVDSAIFEIASFLFAISKLWEWFDTVLLVVNNKSPITLHLYHHSTTLLIFMYTKVFKSISFFPVVLNSFVHFFMYLYYYKPIRIIRQSITTLQIVQLGSTNLGCLYVFMNCQEKINQYQKEFVFTFTLILLNLLFFIDFYKTNYKNRKVKTT